MQNPCRKPRYEPLSLCHTTSTVLQQELQERLGLQWPQHTFVNGTVPGASPVRPSSVSPARTASPPTPTAVVSPRGAATSEGPNGGAGPPWTQHSPHYGLPGSGAVSSSPGSHAVHVAASYRPVCLSPSAERTDKTVCAVSGRGPANGAPHEQYSLSSPQPVSVVPVPVPIAAPTAPTPAPPPPPQQHEADCDQLLVSMTHEEVAAAEADEALARRIQEEELLAAQQEEHQHEQERQRLLQEQELEQQRELQVQQERERDREQHEQQLAMEQQQQQQQEADAHEAGKSEDYMAFLGSPAEVYKVQFGDTAPADASHSSAAAQPAQAGCSAGAVPASSAAVTEPGASADAALPPHLAALMRSPSNMYNSNNQASCSNSSSQHGQQPGADGVRVSARELRGLQQDPLKCLHALRGISGTAAQHAAGAGSPEGSHAKVSKAQDMQQLARSRAQDLGISEEEVLQAWEAEHKMLEKWKEALTTADSACEQDVDALAQYFPTIPKAELQGVMEAFQGDLMAANDFLISQQEEVASARLLQADQDAELARCMHEREQEEQESAPKGNDLGLSESELAEVLGSEDTSGYPEAYANGGSGGPSKTSSKAGASPCPSPPSGVLSHGAASLNSLTPEMNVWRARTVKRTAGSALQQSSAALAEMERQAEAQSKGQHTPDVHADVEEERAVWREVEANRKARKLGFLSSWFGSSVDRGLLADVLNSCGGSLQAARSQLKALGLAEVEQGEEEQVDAPLQCTSPTPTCSLHPSATPRHLPPQPPLVRTAQTMKAALAASKRAAALRSGNHGHSHKPGSPTLSSHHATAATPSLGTTTCRELSLAGKHTEAIALQLSALEQRQKVLGPAHPSTLSSMHNLAVFLGRAGEHGQAAALQQQVVEARCAQLGSEHPSSLASMHSLASYWAREGRLQEAWELQQSVLEAQQRVLGPAHPATLASMHSLARHCAREGREEEAWGLQQEVEQLRALAEKQAGGAQQCVPQPRGDASVGCVRGVSSPGKGGVSKAGASSGVEGSPGRGAMAARLQQLVLEQQQQQQQQQQDMGARAGGSSRGLSRSRTPEWVGGEEEDGGSELQLQELEQERGGISSEEGSEDDASLAERCAAEESGEDVNAAFEREWEAVVANAPDKETMFMKCEVLYHKLRKESERLHALHRSARVAAARAEQRGHEHKALTMWQHAESTKAKWRPVALLVAAKMHALLNASSRGQLEWDFHKLHVWEALTFLRQHIDAAALLPGPKEVRVITGRGVHSKGEPKLLHAFRDWFVKQGLRFIEHKGYFTLYLDPPAPPNRPDPTSSA